MPRKNGPTVAASEFTYPPTPQHLDRNAARPWSAQDQQRAELAQEWMIEQAGQALEKFHALGAADGDTDENSGENATAQ